MKPLEALREGIHSLNGTRRMWFVFWFYNLCFALVAVLPLSILLARDLGHSAYGREMLHNFDVQWFSEFFVKSGGWPAALFTPLALILGAAYLLLSTFLYGGVLTVLCSPEGRYRPALFYEGCGRNFGRLFRLLLLSVVCYGVAVTAGSLPRGIAEGLWGKGMEARPLVIFNWFRLGFLLLLLLFVNMVFDYAKIRLVATGSREAVRAAIASFGLVGRNFGRCAGTYALVAGLAVAVFLVYAGLTGPLPRETAWGLLLVVLIQQAYVIGRIWVKLLFVSSQLRMYSFLQPPPTPVVQEPSPVEPAQLSQPADIEPRPAERDESFVRREEGDAG